MVSVFAQGKAQVKYTPKKWAEAPKWLKEKGYHVLAFNTRRDAKVWIDGLQMVFPYCALEIWEAEADAVREPKEMLDFTLLPQGIAVRWDHEWPLGTVMCRRIKLLKKVWPNAKGNN